MCICNRKFTDDNKKDMLLALKNILNIICDCNLETGPGTIYVSLVFVVLYISGRDYTVLELLYGGAVFKHVA